jgi:hypothetical protein
MPVMGYAAAKNADQRRLEVFKQGLRELGYFEGKNIAIECRDAVLDAEYSSVIAGLVNRKWRWRSTATMLTTSHSLNWPVQKLENLASKFNRWTFARLRMSIQHSVRLSHLARRHS